MNKLYVNKKTVLQTLFLWVNENKENDSRLKYLYSPHFYIGCNNYPISQCLEYGLNFSLPLIIYPFNNDEYNALALWVGYRENGNNKIDTSILRETEIYKENKWFVGIAYNTAGAIKHIKDYLGYIK